MKRILFLLLLTVSVYGQNPSRFAKIQITGNTNSGTATKVNVQEANGEVNTQTINTGFNKNIGLGGSDIVGATTLLNQYSTTPIEWTATAFNSGQVVFFVGKQWISKIATVAGDVPAASSKWDEITFEALANKTVIVDATPTDGSNNAVSSNAVFDGLALKSNIGHTHVASQITDLSKASVGLGNVDNTSDLSKPLSTATINALATKFPTPTGLTTNYLPKWNGSGFVNSAIFNSGTTTNINTANFTSIDLDYQSYVSGGATITGKYNTTKNTAIALGNRTVNTGGIDFLTSNGGGLMARMTIAETGNVGIGTTNPTANLTVKGAYSVGSSIPTDWALLSAGRMGVAKNNKSLYFDIFNNYAEVSTYDWSLGQGYPMVFQANGGNSMFGTNVDNGVDKVQVNGTISASPATTANQVPTWGQVQAIAKPYKVYTALLIQTGTSAPIATVLENTLGGVVTWNYVSVGFYQGSLSSAFTLGKTAVFMNTTMPNSQFIGFVNSVNSIGVRTYDTSAVPFTLTDGKMPNTSYTSIEIRVYN